MGYECIMCMELLESPAPDSLVSISTLNDPDNEINAGWPGGRNNCKSSSTTEDLTKICATVCGHMFHRACLNRWFHQKMKKECPSCRKLLTPGKIFHLYPPSSSDDFSSNSINRSSKLQLSAFEERCLPQVHCSNEGCKELYEIHKTLVSDYNQLRAQFTENSDNLAFTTAQMQSLEDECARLKNISNVGKLEPSTSSFGTGSGNYKMKKCPLCNKYTKRTSEAQECRYCNKPENKPGCSKKVTSKPKANTSVATRTRTTPTIPAIRDLSNIADFLTVTHEVQNPTTLFIPAVSTSYPNLFRTGNTSSSSATPSAGTSNTNYSGTPGSTSPLRFTFEGPENRVIRKAKRSTMWNCSSCYFENYSVAHQCSFCGNKNPSFPKEWIIPGSSTSTSSASATTTAAASLNAPRTAAGGPMWICLNCTVPNEPNASVCLFCAGKNPTTKKASITDAAAQLSLKDQTVKGLVQAPLTSVPPKASFDKSSTTQSSQNAGQSNSSTTVQSEQQRHQDQHNQNFDRRPANLLPMTMTVEASRMPQPFGSAIFTSVQTVLAADVTPRPGQNDYLDHLLLPTDARTSSTSNNGPN